MLRLLLLNFAGWPLRLLLLAGRAGVAASTPGPTPSPTPPVTSCRTAATFPAYMPVLAFSISFPAAIPRRPISGLLAVPVVMKEPAQAKSKTISSQSRPLLVVSRTQVRRRSRTMKDLLLGRGHGPVPQCRYSYPGHGPALGLLRGLDHEPIAAC